MDRSSHNTRRAGPSRSLPSSEAQGSRHHRERQRPLDFPSEAKDLLCAPRGATIVELAMSLTIAGLLLGLTVPRIGDQLDRIAARGAARDVKTVLAVARARAIGGARPTSVHFHPADTTLVLLRGRDTLQIRRVGDIYGVSLKATRDSTAFGVNGLGIARANVSVVLKRKTAAETVFVSREGRVR